MPGGHSIINKKARKMEGRYIYKRFVIDVNTQNTSYSKKFDLDKNIRVVTALQLSSDNPKLLYYRGSQRLEISGDELYPEDFESKLLMSGLGTSPDDRYTVLGEVQSGNGEVKVLYKDSDNANAPFSSYKVSIILKCVLK
jgi:hypothetical protein